MYSLILHGRRSLELQKCRNLRFSVQNVAAFSNYFSSTSVVTDVSPEDDKKGQTFTVSYLVGSLGFTTKLAESVSRKVSFEDKGNPDSVLSLLRSHGFTDSQISGIVSDYPRLLILDAEKSIAPKLQFLLSREGASTSELTEIVTKVPKILGKKEGKPISLYYDFVKDILREESDTRISPLEDINRNVLALRESGVPQKLLSHLLNSSCGLPVYGKEKFEESLKKVVEMGFDPTTSTFVQALRVVYGMSDKTVDEKVQVYKRLGLAVEDVWTMFKKYPFLFMLSEDKILNSMETFLSLGFSRDECLIIVKRCPRCVGYSENSIKKKTEFLVKKMNWPLKALVLIPQVFNYSMEKRIVPRCNVIKALLSKGVLGTEISPIASVLICTDEVFLNRYVKKHNDKELVAELIAIFTRKEEKNK